MLKTKLYQEIVNERKNHKFPPGLINPSKIEKGIYDTGTHIGSWSKWQGNLGAKIMVIGKEWGNVSYYIKNKGMDAYTHTNKLKKIISKSIRN